MEKHQGIYLGCMRLYQPLCTELNCQPIDTHCLAQILQHKAMLMNCEIRVELSSEIGSQSAEIWIELLVIPAQEEEEIDWMVL